jgi:hypothetical protein
MKYVDKKVAKKLEVIDYDNEEIPRDYLDTEQSAKQKDIELDRED